MITLELIRARGPMIAMGMLLVMLLVGGGGIGWSVWQRQTAQEMAQQVSTEIGATRERLAEIKHRLVLWRQFGAPYQLAVTQSALLHPEDRLVWAEQFDAWQVRTAHPALFFSAAPRETLNVAGLVVPSGMALFGTKMEVDGQFLHEGYVLDWLSTLNHPKLPRAMPQHCVLDRPPRETGAVSGEPQERVFALSMHCTIVWLTLLPAPVVPTEVKP